MFCWFFFFENFLINFFCGEFFFIIFLWFLLVSFEENFLLIIFKRKFFGDFFLYKCLSSKVFPRFISYFIAKNFWKIFLCGKNFFFVKFFKGKYFWTKVYSVEYFFLNIFASWIFYFIIKTFKKYYFGYFVFFLWFCSKVVNIFNRSFFKQRKKFRWNTFGEFFFVGIFGFFDKFFLWIFTTMKNLLGKKLLWWIFFRWKFLLLYFLHDEVYFIFFKCFFLVSKFFIKTNVFYFDFVFSEFFYIILFFD